MNESANHSIVQHHQTTNALIINFSHQGWELIFHARVYIGTGSPECPVVNITHQCNILVDKYISSEIDSKIVDLDMCKSPKKRKIIVLMLVKAIKFHSW